MWISDSGREVDGKEESFHDSSQEIHAPSHRKNKQNYDYINESFPVNPIWAPGYTIVLINSEY